MIRTSPLQPSSRRAVARSLVAGAALVALVACGESDPPGTVDAALKQAAVVRHRALVRAAYARSIAGAEAMQTAIAAFVASPTAETHAAAKAAWTAARPAYIETEAFRFYDGPIDGAPDNLEARMNGWPLDEVFIDYTVDAPTGGIINDVARYPTIDVAVVRDNNERGGEKNLSAGWHAIEFLLWGQDLSATGPGARPHTDFVSGTSSTAAHQDRRRAYLTAATALLLDDLRAVAAAWAPGTGAYGEAFTKDADASLRDVFQGIGYLAAVELAKQRILNAFAEQDQEEEHSCFSDTTPQDNAADGRGIENVYLGRIDGASSEGLDAVVAALDPALDASIKARLVEARAAVDAIPAPFDQAILSGPTCDAGVKLQAAVKAWEDVAQLLLQASNRLGYRLVLE
jgi:putative iron-regulated protein